MIGTVCETTRYGMIARSAQRNRAITMARPMPRDEPRTKATIATRSEYHVARMTTTKIDSVPPRISGSHNRFHMLHTCGMARSPVRGSSRTPNSVPPSSGPIAL